VSNLLYSIRRIASGSRDRASIVSFFFRLCDVLRGVIEVGRFGNLPPPLFVKRVCVLSIISRGEFNV
jgi:hypothetical protein